LNEKYVACGLSGSLCLCIRQRASWQAIVACRPNLTMDSICGYRVSEDGSRHIRTIGRHHAVKSAAHGFSALFSSETSVCQTGKLSDSVYVNVPSNRAAIVVSFCSHRHECYVSDEHSEHLFLGGLRSASLLVGIKSMDIGNL